MSLIEVTQFKILPEEVLEYFHFWKLRGRNLLVNEVYNLEILGYESTLMIDNIETMYLFILMYVLGLLILMTLRLCKPNRVSRWL